MRAAIAISPEFAPPYGVLAMYVANQGNDLPEALKLAQKAQALEPGNINYQIDLAQRAGANGSFQEARKIAQDARVNATDPRERAEAERFLAYLDQVEPDSSGAIRMQQRLLWCGSRPAMQRVLRRARIRRRGHQTLRMRSRLAAMQGLKALPLCARRRAW